MRVGTLNLASGRDAAGRSVDAAALRAALAEVDVDVLAVQEVDVGQPRSAGVDQPAEVAAALGATDWRFAAAVAGTPDPFRSWRPVDPPVLGGPDDDLAGPRYGIALFSKAPVRRWSRADVNRCAGRGRSAARGRGRAAAPSLDRWTTGTSGRSCRWPGSCSSPAAGSTRRRRPSCSGAAGPG